MVAISRTAEFRARLAAVQAESRRLRLEAFVPYAPLLCGLRLRPITFPSYLTLLAWRNAFVTGGPVELKDIVQFVWCHHPAFDQFAPAARRAVARRVDRCLRPRFPTLNQLVHFFSPLPRFRWLARFRRPTEADRTAAVVAEIRRLVREALHDFPAAGGEEDEAPMPFALQPQLVSLLMRGHALPFAEAVRQVTQLPLKELLQYIREILHRLSHGKDKLLTPEEARVWADYIDHKTEVARLAAHDSRLPARSA